MVICLLEIQLIEAVLAIQLVVPADQAKRGQCLYAIAEQPILQFDPREILVN